MASRVCWNCGESAHQTMVLDPKGVNVREALTASSQHLWYAPYRCDECGHMSLGSATFNYGTVSTSASAKLLMNRPSVALDWYPHRSLGKRFDDVPHPIDAAASEAWACYSIGQHRASVLMARAVVEAAAKDKGATTGSLMTKIDTLYKDEVIGRGVKDAAHEIRYLGNDMAHGDFVTNVTEEANADVLNFLDTFLDEVYQREAKLSRFRAQRLSPKTAD